MKILCIGNSFSQDATRYLESVSDGKLFVRNCYIGGCSLERHVICLQDGGEHYEYQKDAAPIQKIALQAALCAEPWDHITVQQVSGLSGIADSYEPWLTILLDGIRAKCPSVPISFHRTWAYETDATHPDFSRYGNDQSRMFRAITEASNQQATAHGLPIIPAGDVIQEVRAQQSFDVRNGGHSLNRDGFHLNHYGRYLAALIWNAYFTATDPIHVSYEPDPDPLYAILRANASDFWRKYPI